MNLSKTEVFKLSYSWLGLKPTSELKSYTILQQGNNQIRKFRPFLIAQTFVHASAEEAWQIGRERLNRFTQGENEQNQSWEATSPFFLAEAQGEGNSHWMLSYVLPADMTMQTAPVPLNANIQIKRIPSLLVATHKFHGKYSLERIDQGTQILQNWLTSLPQYNIKSRPRYAVFEKMLWLSFSSHQEIHITVGNN